MDIVDENKLDSAGREQTSPLGRVYIHDLSLLSPVIRGGNALLASKVLADVGVDTSVVSWGKYLSKICQDFLSLHKRVSPSPKDYELLAHAMQSSQDPHGEDYAYVRSQLMARKPSNLAWGVDHSDNLIKGQGFQLSRVVQELGSQMGLGKGEMHLFCFESPLEEFYARIIANILGLDFHVVDKSPISYSGSLAEEYIDQLKAVLKWGHHRKIRELFHQSEEFAVKVDLKTLIDVNKEENLKGLHLAIVCSSKEDYAVCLAQTHLFKAKRGGVLGLSLTLEEQVSYNNISNLQDAIWCSRFLLGQEDVFFEVSSDTSELKALGRYTQENMFSYNLSEENDAGFIYRESMNGTEVRAYELSEGDVTILSLVHKEAITYESLLERYKEAYPEGLDVSVIDIIETLRQEGLIYLNRETQKLASAVARKKA